MRKAIKISFFLLLCSPTVNAQETVYQSAPRFSPIVNSDQSVSFVLNAPQADSVKIVGSFISSPVKMIRDSNGVWTATVSGLKPDLYNYRLEIDGVLTSDPSNPYLMRDISTQSNIFVVPGNHSDLYLSQDTPHGSLTKGWYHSSSLGMNRRISIYTPPGYDAAENKERRYPVFYLLHGMGGDEDAWSELGRATQILDNLIAQGKAEPMIVVMPNGNATRQAAPGYTAEGLYLPEMMHSVSPQGAFEESFPEIIEYIDSNYRTLADKRHRAIAGLSMGGGHTWRISMMYPDLADYIGLFSAAVRWNGHGTSEDKGFPADEADMLKTQFSKIPRLYWIGIGKDDFLWDLNAKYRQFLDNNNYPYEYNESEGGHTWTNWRDYLVTFTPRLFK